MKKTSPAYRTIGIQQGYDRRTRRTSRHLFCDEEIPANRCEIGWHRLV